MLTLNECIEILKNTTGETPKIALDFGGFYTFDSAEPGELTGTEFPAVNKENGKVFLYDITSNGPAYQKAKTITL